MRSITLTHVGYDYMNARLIHGQIFTGCSNSLMGCTQDEQDKQDEATRRCRATAESAFPAQALDGRPG